MIEVKNLVKRYGGYAAVDHLSFTIAEGQIYGLLGPNGAGKTTTMNMMTGYLGATEGEILINGHNVLEEPEEAKKCIGYLPELPPLYMDMTVGEYLSFAAQLKGIKKSERREAVEKAMELTGLYEVEGRLIKNLSKGFRQRVGLSQAVLGFPRIIILDEPMVGLDPKQIIEIRDLIRSLAVEHTVIVSSHILSEISAICDYILILSHGRLVASDTPEGLEKLTSGFGRLSLTVKGEEENIRRILAGIEGIESLELIPSQEEEAWELTIEEAPETDLREPLFYAFAEGRCPILMMKPCKASLEEVFLELTDDSGSGPDGESALYAFSEDNPAVRENEEEQEDSHDGSL